ncbi:hypothetical protein JKP88DRAFT_265259 [Tribonema minus]|uniref:Uncharacterized protein n=1 Tax=Tribonema minus TaxID=303371 RepID=A0A836C9C1_9STRA|nr:hypothetical protein JKP88DRAFT_265259 [Tribonema minus]
MMPRLGGMRHGADALTDAVLDAIADEGGHDIEAGEHQRLIDPSLHADNATDASPEEEAGSATAAKVAIDRVHADASARAWRTKAAGKVAVNATPESVAQAKEKAEASLELAAAAAKARGVSSNLAQAAEERLQLASSWTEYQRANATAAALSESARRDAEDRVDTRKPHEIGAMTPREAFEYLRQAATKWENHCRRLASTFWWLNSAINTLIGVVGLLVTIVPSLLPDNQNPWLQALGVVTIVLAFIKQTVQASSTQKTYEQLADEFRKIKFRLHDEDSTIKDHITALQFRGGVAVMRTLKSKYQRYLDDLDVLEDQVPDLCCFCWCFKKPPSSCDARDAVGPKRQSQLQVEHAASSGASGAGPQQAPNGDGAVEDISAQSGGVPSSDAAAPMSTVKAAVSKMSTGIRKGAKAAPQRYSSEDIESFHRQQQETLDGIGDGLESFYRVRVPLPHADMATSIGGLATQSSGSSTTTSSSGSGSGALPAGSGAATGRGTAPRPRRASTGSAHADFQPNLDTIKEQASGAKRAAAAAGGGGGSSSSGEQQSGDAQPDAAAPTVQESFKREDIMARQSLNRGSKEGKGGSSAQGTGPLPVMRQLLSRGSSN